MARKVKEENKEKPKVSRPKTSKDTETKATEKIIKNETLNSKNEGTKVKEENCETEEVLEKQDESCKNADNISDKTEDLPEEKPKDEYEILNSKLQRLQADFYNYKQRIEREKTATYGNAVSDVITDLLGVLDNFERALNMEDSKNEEVISFKNGMNMIYGQFVSVLQKKGLKEIDALGAKFDPNKHAGIGFEANQEKEEDTIIEVFQKGYTVNDKVVRPSMVKIVKNN